MEVIQHLIDLRLRADADERLVDLYEFALRDSRPDAEEIDYIDQQLKLRRSQKGFAPFISPARPGQLPTRAVIDALRSCTPLARIYAWVNKIGPGWAEDIQRVDKAYVMACFSEAAYLHLANNELPGRDRYKIFPSMLFFEMMRSGWRIDVTETFPLIADVATQVIDTGRFVYVIYRLNHFAVVAVRGTVSLADWGINLNALMTRTEVGGYHKGFFTEAMLAAPLIQDALRRINFGDGLLYFTGHSLGGAVAALLPRVWCEPHRVMRPYVFASPRFAALSVVEASPTFGYVAPDDLIPHLPPRLSGYADAEQPPEVVPCGHQRLSGLYTLLSWLTPGHGFWKPHSIERYRFHLGEQIGEAFPETVYVDALNQLP